MKKEMLKRMVALSIALSVIPCGMASAEKAVVQEGTEDSTKWTAIVVNGRLDPAKNESAQVGSDGYGSIAIGNGAKANVGTDLGADNAIAIGASSNAAGQYGIAVGLKADATAYGTTAIGTLSGATSKGASALGGWATASGESSTALGYYASASRESAVAIGNNAIASGDYSIAEGCQAQASGAGAIAEGCEAAASGDLAIAEGYQAQASGAGAIAEGYQAEASGKLSVAEGYQAVASAENATAIGNGAQATHANSVALGAGSVTAEADSVSIGSADQTRKLQFVTDGAVSADSTDAVNGSQLYEEMQAREDADEALQTQIDTKADAATEDARHATFIATATDLDARITAEATARQNAIAQEAITRDAADTRLQSQIDTKADAATEDARHATFIATATDLDARITAEATARQNAVAQESLARWQEDLRLESGIQQNASGIMNLGQQLNTLDGRVDKVGAGAAALAALHPLEYDPDDKLTFSAGMGNYAGENAAALGAFYRPNEKFMVSLGGTMGNGENMVNLGLSIGLDKPNGYAKLSKRELIQKVNAMEAKYEAVEAENEAMKDQLANADERIAKLEALVAQLVKK